MVWRMSPVHFFLLAGSELSRIKGIHFRSSGVKRLCVCSFTYLMEIPSYESSIPAKSPIGPIPASLSAYPLSDEEGRSAEERKPGTIPHFGTLPSAVESVQVGR